jgi:O-glycosyl hydrolase
MFFRLKVKFLCAITIACLLGLAGTVVPTASAAESIAVNPALKYQTMTGWEALARSWEIDKVNNKYDPSWRTHAAAVADRMVNELGINRIAMPLDSGWANPNDYWTKFVNGQLTYTQWSALSYQAIDPNSHQFAEFDFYADTVLMPMKQRLAARGEKLFVNMIFEDGDKAPGTTYFFAHNPAAYAAFVQVYVDRLKTKYGVVLDAYTIINEPDNTKTWRGAEIGKALVAVRSRLNAAGYSNVELIAPSVASPGNALPYLTAIAGVPGALAALDTVSYHRYGSADIAAIRSWAAQRGKETAMSELFTASVDTVLDDLLVGQVSSWQKWSVAGKKGGSLNGYYVADLSNPAAPVFSFAPKAAHMALVFPYVRLGAVRVDAQSATMRTAAFVNANGSSVVVAKRSGGTGSEPVTISGLKPGTYGVRSIAAGSTQAFNQPDVTAAANGTLTVTLAEGYTTVYGKGATTQPPGHTGQLSFAAPTTFGNVTVGATSPVKTITLTNVGGSAVKVQSIASGNAAEFPVSGSTCGTVNAGSTCSFNVSFKPAGAGARMGTLTVTSDGAGSPQGVNVTGTGITSTSVGQLSFATTLALGNQAVGTTSAAKTVTVTNVGGSAVAVQSISSSNTVEIPIASSSCGTVNPGASCTFSVVFKPSVAGARAAKITVTSNGAGSPQAVNATGTGITGTAPGQLSFPLASTFSNRSVGTTSEPRVIAIANLGASTVTVQSIVSSNAAEFPVTSSTCGSLAAGSKCTFRVTFRPVTAGTRTGTVTVTSNGAGSPQRMSVSGLGVSSSSSPPEETIDLVEYYHQGWDHYFVTSDSDEMAKLDEGTFEGWERTGQQFKAYPKDGTNGTKVCRFFSTSFAPRSSHFYTAFPSECAIVSGNPDWSLEGDVFLISTPADDGACAADTDPVYRLYNNGEGDAPNHRYTTDEGVRMQMVEQGWTPEGYGPAGVIMCSPH